MTTIRVHAQPDVGAFLKPLLWLLVATTIFRGIVGATLPFIDDEAYYWLWAHHLDWSYLDHPPMIAYIVFLTTHLGDAEIWIRLGPVVMGAATAYTLFLLGRDLFDARAGFIAAVLFQIVPVLTGGALLATPDSPLFLAWALAMRFVWQALHGSPRRWTAAGVVVGLGLLSKLTMVFHPVGVLVFLILYRRQWFTRAEPYLAALLAAILFLPVLYWNATHDWAMVRFILSERRGGTPHGLAGIEEVLIQQLLFALLLFPAFVVAAYLAWRRRADERFGYLLWTSLAPMVFTLLAAAAAGAPHGNWVGPGLAIVLAAAWNRRAAVLAGITGALVVYGFIVPFVSALPPLPGAEGIYGWKEAAARVQQEARAFPGTPPVLVADRYQTAAQLAYYTRNAVPVVLLPCPNPASIWPKIQRFQGANSLTVIDARSTPDIQWSDYFVRVQELAPLTVQFNHRPLRTFRLLRLEGLSLKRTCGRPIELK
jgi:dolichol-phosphate mannosyltransferase